MRSDHTVEKRDLKVGQIGNGSAVIDNGVEPGEQVVTAGYARLQPGAHVAATLDEKTSAAGN